MNIQWSCTLVHGRQGVRPLGIAGELPGATSGLFSLACEAGKHQHHPHRPFWEPHAISTLGKQTKERGAKAVFAVHLSLVGGWCGFGRAGLPCFSFCGLWPEIFSFLLAVCFSSGHGGFHQASVQIPLMGRDWLSVLKGQTHSQFRGWVSGPTCKDQARSSGAGRLDVSPLSSAGSWNAGEGGREHKFRRWTSMAWWPLRAFLRVSVCSAEGRGIQCFSTILLSCKIAS